MCVKVELNEFLSIGSFVFVFKSGCLLFNFYLIFYFFTATGCCSLLEQTGLYGVLIQYHVSEPVYGLALVAHNIEVLFS